MEIQAIPKKTERRSFVQFCDIGNAIAICETVSVFPSFISSVSEPESQIESVRKGHISTLGFDSV